MVLSRLFERRSGTSNPDKWLVEALGGGGKTVSGVTVNEKTAMGCATVFACNKIIGETCAMLPIHVFEHLKRGKKRLRKHPIARLVGESPNDDMIPQVFWETVVGHAASTGGGFAEILPTGEGSRGYPAAMEVRTPDRMTVKRVRAKDGQMKVEYRYQPEYGGAPYAIPPESVFHLVGFGYDGVRGYSPIDLHRQMIGLSMSAVQHNAAFFGRGAHPGGAIEYPNKFKSIEAQRDFRRDWNRVHQGSENAYETAILPDGMKYHPFGVSAKDAQTVELLGLTVDQIAQIYRMPLHKLQKMDQATYNNIENKSLEFKSDTIMPWLRRIVQEIKRKLFLPTDEDLFVEHILEELLRGDILTRYQAYQIAITNGWKSQNDVRELENDNPVPGGDTYRVQAQMTPLDQIGEEPKESPKPKAAPGGEDDDDDDRMALVAESYRGLFEDAYSRILRVEMDRLRAAAKREGDFAAWLERFYEEQKRHVRGVMGAAVDAAGGAMYALRAGRPAGREALQQLGDYAAELADRHTQLGYAAAYQAASRGGSILEAVEAVCEGWKGRPAQLAEQEVRLLSAAVAKLVELN